MYVTFALIFRTCVVVPDEVVHYWQINKFDHGEFRLAEDYLTMLPGYHALAAAILWITDLRTLGAARMLNGLFGVFTIFAFWRLRRCAWEGPASAAALQFALLPILFPYDFRVYTDVLSLGVVLLATAETLRDRHRTAGLLMIASMAMRQTNVVWLPLLSAIAVWPNGKLEIPHIGRLLRRVWPYLIGVALFVAYWIWNGHISLSKEQASNHPDLSAHVGNIYFALVVFALLMPLQVALGLRHFAANVRARPWLVLLPLAGFIAFWTLFKVDHPFNQVSDPPYLHNYLILLTQQNILLKAMFGMIAVVAACGLSGIRLQPRTALLLYPVAFVALAAFWLIEHRYMLIPISLWLAFRERESQRVETATTALWAFYTVSMCLGIVAGKFNL